MSKNSINLIVFKLFSVLILVLDIYVAVGFRIRDILIAMVQNLKMLDMKISIFIWRKWSL